VEETQRDKLERCWSVISVDCNGRLLVYHTDRSTGWKVGVELREMVIDPLPPSLLQSPVTAIHSSAILIRSPTLPSFSENSARRSEEASHSAQRINVSQLEVTKYTRSP